MLDVREGWSEEGRADLREGRTLEMQISEKGNKIEIRELTDN